MRLSKSKIIYFIITIILVVLVYIACCKYYYGKVFFMYGNSNRHTWEMEDLQKAAKDFQIDDEGAFLSTSSDPWFLIEESFPARTIVIDVDGVEDKRNSQVFYYSDSQELTEERSYYFQLHEGLNYLQISGGLFNKFRLDLTDSSDVSLKIKNITTYGSRVMPTLFLIIVIGISLILSRIIYIIVFRKNIFNIEKMILKKCGIKENDKKYVEVQKSELIKDKMQSISYLRIVALGMILYDHLGAMRNSEWIVKRVVDFILCTPLKIIQDFGALGVSIFYLITGFLFLHSNKKKENPVISSCRKVIKLYLFTMSSFVIFGIFQWGLNHISPTYWRQFSLNDWIGCATLLNHFNGEGEIINGTTWFLVPLFVFYIVVSICYQIAKKNMLKFWLLLEGSMVIIGVLGELCSQQYTGLAYALSLIPFIYMPIMGLVIYSSIAGEITHLQGAGLGFLNYVMMVLTFHGFNPGYYADSPYIISLVYAVLLLLLFVLSEKSFKESVIIKFFEKISLSTYLVHMMWGGLFMSLIEPVLGFSSAFVVTLGIVILVAWIHYIFIDKGILKKI